jgi:hypothetical protein
MDVLRSELYCPLNCQSKACSWCSVDVRLGSWLCENAGLGMTGSIRGNGPGSDLGVCRFWGSDLILRPPQAVLSGH